jgi:hypothetical protein
MAISSNRPVKATKIWDEIIVQVDANESAITTLQSDVTTLETNATKTVVTDVDASAGGTAETTAIATIPANSLLLNVTAVVTTPFDGDATTTAEVGIATNADAYIDTSDFDPSAGAGTQASSLNGATNDVKTAQYLSAETDIIATWTNTASMTAGEVKVIVTYVELA